MKRIYMAGCGGMLGQALDEEFDPLYLARPLQVESVLGMLRWPISPTGIRSRGRATTYRSSW